jgi:DNA-directed RNA polymerase specialized sigma24 family protein
VLREIDERLAVLERELVGYSGLVEERARLLAARASLTGEARVNAATGARRLSQDEVAEYLRLHPGSRAGEIARALQVPLANVSQHLYRAKHGRFEARGAEWFLRAMTDGGDG